MLFRVENFKSLKNVEVELRGFNVLVGENGSGKTNFIEALKLLKKIVTEETIPRVPFRDWWGYDKIVWRGDVSKVIRFELVVDYPRVKGGRVRYEVYFSGEGGTPIIHLERISLLNYFTVERRGNGVRVVYDPKYLRELKNLRGKFAAVFKDRVMVDGLLSENPAFVPVKIDRSRTFLSKYRSQLMFTPYVGSMDFREIVKSGYFPCFIERKLFVVFPARMIEDRRVLEMFERRMPVMNFVRDMIRYLYNFIDRIVVLRQLYLERIKAPAVPAGANEIGEHGEGLVGFLYSQFVSRGVSERVGRALANLFPGFRLSFELTSTGEVLLEVFEDDLKLYPPMVPDSLLKVLAVMAALDMKPSILAIDEIENHLHAEILEYVLDELRNSDSTVIVSTHSPAVVDLVDIGDLCFVSKDAGGTKIGRVRDVEAARRKLSEAGITVSEGWLYGRLKDL